MKNIWLHIKRGFTYSFLMAVIAFVEIFLFAGVQILSMTTLATNAETSFGNITIVEILVAIINLIISGYVIGFVYEKVK